MLSWLTLPSPLADIRRRHRGIHGQDGTMARRFSASPVPQVWTLVAEHSNRVLLIVLLLSILIMLTKEVWTRPQETRQDPCASSTFFPIYALYIQLEAIVTSIGSVV